MVCESAVLLTACGGAGSPAGSDVGADGVSPAPAVLARPPEPVGPPPYRTGTIVSRGTEFVSYDDDGGRRAGQRGYLNSAGIEVLTVFFDGDEYSYSR